MNRKNMSDLLPAWMRKLSPNARILILLSAILIFLVAAVSVSISMFLKADRMSAQAEVLNRVVRETDSLAEVLKASDSSTGAAAELLQEHRGAEVSDDVMTLYYTGDFEPSSKSDCSYRVSILLTPGTSGSCDAWKISWFQKTEQKSFYHISFKTVSQSSRE